MPMIAKSRKAALYLAANLSSSRDVGATTGRTYPETMSATMNLFAFPRLTTFPACQYSSCLPSAENADSIMRDQWDQFVDACWREMLGKTTAAETHGGDLHRPCRVMYIRYISEAVEPTTLFRNLLLRCRFSRRSGARQCGRWGLKECG